MLTTQTQKSLVQRTEELENAMPRELSVKLMGLADFFGKDAAMAAILKWLELDRSDTEKLAEVALGLVPGQIKEVRPANSRYITVPHLNLRDLHFVECPLESSALMSFDTAYFEIQDWMTRIRIAFDEETGTLFVREPGTDIPAFRESRHYEESQLARYDELFEESLESIRDELYEENDADAG